MMPSTFLRPRRSAGRPALIAPTMVPMRAVATVKPSENSLRWKTSRRFSVVPEITAVSKPKRRPPSAATTALRITREFVLLR